MCLVQMKLALGALLTPWVLFDLLAQSEPHMLYQSPIEACMYQEQYMPLARLCSEVPCTICTNMHQLIIP